MPDGTRTVYLLQATSEPLTHEYETGAEREQLEARHSQGRSGSPAKQSYRGTKKPVCRRTGNEEDTGREPEMEQSEEAAADICHPSKRHLEHNPLLLPKTV